MLVCYANSSNLCVSQDPSEVGAHLCPPRGCATVTYTTEEDTRGQKLLEKSRKGMVIRCFHGEDTCPMNE